MKASDQFKTAIENYLSETALSDTAFASHFAKESKSLENCINYIFGEVKKTGLCAFDNQEIYDIAVKYYSDDSILAPAPISCKAVVNQPVKADLFTPATTPQNTEQKREVINTPKTLQTTLTFFDL
ncbi:PcfK-like family protein [Flavobacterium sp. EDS]|uniref:PcfK-like family protein n=1 Tax=Flavobacterium sp. EDS TaxID=2897328 RepID=UPI001E4374DB|nr:Cas9 inhibitor AcrIIA9 family protein [Flavobacterium sp. EDS]MCD0474012.1 PcfK-like family protein [Flavobacterium sp. EDS]